MHRGVAWGALILLASSGAFRSQADEVLSPDFTRLTERFRLLEHDHMVRALTFTSDGRRLLSASKDTRVITWDVATGKPAHVFNGHKDWVWKALPLKDGKRVLSCGDDRILLWELATGKILAEYPAPGRAIAINRDETVFLSYGVEKAKGMLRLWDMEKGTCREILLNLPFEHARVWAPVSFSQDDRWVATCGKRRDEILLWDGASMKPGPTLTQPSGIHAASWAFSPDAKLLAVGCVDGRVSLWDIVDAKPLRSFEGHEGNLVHGLTFTPDGRFLLSACYDKTSCIWEVATGKRISTLKTDERLLDVAISPDGSTIALSGDGTGVTGSGKKSSVFLYSHGATDAEP